MFFSRCGTKALVGNAKNCLKCGLFLSNPTSESFNKTTGFEEFKKKELNGAIDPISSRRPRKPKFQYLYVRWPTRDTLPGAFPGSFWQYKKGKELIITLIITITVTKPFYYFYGILVLTHRLRLIALSSSISISCVRQLHAVGVPKYTSKLKKRLQLIHVTRERKPQHVIRVFK